jgi:hypothetical protein
MKTPAILHPVTQKSGAVLVIIALALLGLLGVVGMAIDLGFNYGVKGQLQTAADAGALAGADRLFPLNGSTTPSSFPSPQWLTAKAASSTFIKENPDIRLNDDDISVRAGYWDVERTAPEFQETTTEPLGRCSNNNQQCSSSADCNGAACLMRHVPAIQVTVRKSVPAFCAKALGWDSFTPAATATAAIGYPKTAQSLFPVAVNKCMVDAYFAQNPMPSPPPEIPIGAPYGPGGSGCNSGQWTSLTLDRNDVPTMKGLMYGTLPIPTMKIDDHIWIDTGAKDGLFQDIESDFIGHVVELPVVRDVGAATNGNTPITGFVYFMITGTTGAPKQIVGSLVAYRREENRSSPGGPRYNAVTQPMLVK